MYKNKIGGTKQVATNFVKSILVFVIFLLYMAPFFIVIINSFKQKRDIITNPFSLSASKGYSLSNYFEAIDKMNYMRSFGNSLFVTGLSTLIVTILAAMTAYYIVRSNTKYSKIIFSLMSAAIIIPFQAIMIPLVSIYGAKLHMLNSRSALILFHVGFAMSMSVFIYQGFIKSDIPVTLEEAAYLDGCTKLQTFFIIVFPLLKPITSTLVILNVLAFWNDYLLPSLVLTKKELMTLPLSTYQFYGTYSANYGTIMAGLVLTVAPILILYIVLQRQIISGIVAGAVKS